MKQPVSDLRPVIYDSAVYKTANVISLCGYLSQMTLARSMHFFSKDILRF